MNPALIMQDECLTQLRTAWILYTGWKFHETHAVFSFAGLAIFSIVWLESSKKFLRIKLELFTF